MTNPVIYLFYFLINLKFLILSHFRGDTLKMNTGIYMETKSKFDPIKSVVWEK